MDYDIAGENISVRWDWMLIILIFRLKNKLKYLQKHHNCCPNLLSVKYTSEWKTQKKWFVWFDCNFSKQFYIELVKLSHFACFCMHQVRVSVACTCIQLSHLGLSLPCKGITRSPCGIWRQALDKWRYGQVLHRHYHRLRYVHFFTWFEGMIVVNTR